MASGPDKRRNGRDDAIHYGITRDQDVSKPGMMDAEASDECMKRYQDVFLDWKGRGKRQVKENKPGS